MKRTYLWGSVAIVVIIIVLVFAGDAPGVRVAKPLLIGALVIAFLGWNAKNWWDAASSQRRTDPNEDVWEKEAGPL